MKKINDLTIFFDDRNKFHESLLRITNHNRLVNRDAPEESVLTVKDLLEHSKKYPKAHIVMENPSEKDLNSMLSDTKFHFCQETNLNIQPIFLFKKIISDENFIVVCVNNEPDLTQINKDELEGINKNGCYLTGERFMELEKKRIDNPYINYHTDIDIYGYWVDDFYFENHNWKSLFKGTQNYLNVFFSHQGNDSSTYILTPHY